MCDLKCGVQTGHFLLEQKMSFVLSGRSHTQLTNCHSAHPYRFLKFLRKGFAQKLDRCVRADLKAQTQRESGK